MLVALAFVAGLSYSIVPEPASACGAALPVNCQGGGGGWVRGLVNSAREAAGATKAVTQIVNDADPGQRVVPVSRDLLPPTPYYHPGLQPHKQ